MFVLWMNSEMIVYHQVKSGARTGMSKIKSAMIINRSGRGNRNCANVRMQNLRNVGLLLCSEMSIK